jgi:DNA-binding transcriptional MerR regulator
MDFNRPLTPKEVASLYGITTRCLRYWLAPYQILMKKNKRKRFFTPEELNFIFLKFGAPVVITKEDRGKG